MVVIYNFRNLTYKIIAMKKIIFLMISIILCGCPKLTFAQSHMYNTQADVERETVPLLNKAQSSRQAKDYKAALKANMEALASLSLFDEDFIKPYGLEKTLLYDIACYQSLCGDTIAAIASLQAAAALGRRHQSAPIHPANLRNPRTLRLQPQLHKLNPRLKRRLVLATP